MNTMVQTPNREDVPTCFGSSHWDPRAVECAGGADPKYTHPKNQSHVRDACDFFQQCGIRSQAARMGAQLIPAQQLRRPPMFPVPPPPAPIVQQQAPTFREYMQHQQRPTQMAVPQYYPPQQQYPYQQPPQVHMAPGQFPASVYQLNYQVPGYLSVPEQRTWGGSVWGLLGREALRAILKALGHTVAGYFDSQPFRLPPPPPPPGGGPQQP